MRAFRVKGTFQMGDRWQDFTKELAGEDENSVREQLYSRLGSKHRVKRTKIKISEVEEISQDEISDPVTKYLLESDKTNEKKMTKKGE